jgi:hypothetical protein
VDTVENIDIIETKFVKANAEALAAKQKFMSNPTNENAEEMVLTRMKAEDLANRFAELVK